MSESPYQTIKRNIAARIARGDYTTGQVLPSESDLCRMFGVSRMTVNRAMRELAAENLVRRVPGVGSFVAEPMPQSDLLEIRNIADEITARGHAHRAEIFCLDSIQPPPAAALAFELPEDTEIFRSAILHYENETPIQFEDRLVNPALAPLYLQQDFTCQTPNAHLQLPEHAPCLLVSRRTWSHGRLAAITQLYHPGSRYRLGGRLQYETTSEGRNHD
jgi:GntR family histidine utilization transcriptional repressor